MACSDFFSPYKRLWLYFIRPSKNPSFSTVSFHLFHFSGPQKSVQYGGNYIPSTNLQLLLDVVRESEPNLLTSPTCSIFESLQDKYDSNAEWELLDREPLKDSSLSSMEAHELKDAPIITRGAFLRCGSSTSTQYGVLGRVVACQ